MVKVSVEIEEIEHGIATKILGHGDESTALESAVANLVTKSVEEVINAMNNDTDIIEREMMNMARAKLEEVTGKLGMDEETNNFVEALMQAMMTDDNDEITEDACVDEPVQASWVKEELAKIAQED
jgi:hypothetical protein